MSSTTVMKAKARLIKEETQEGANTAARVGGLFEDIVDYLDSADVTSSLDITPYVTTGTRIAKFKVNGEETTIFAPSNGGSGGGGGSSYDDTEIREIINELDKALDDTTALANSEKERLNGVIADIDANVKQKMADAIEFAEWVQGNFPEGETGYQSGWNEKTKQFMQVVGMWEQDAQNPVVTTTTWSALNQRVNQLALDVTSIVAGEDVTTEMLQSWIDLAVEDEVASLNLGTTYATQDDTGEILKWLYSALKGSTSEYTTYNQFVSAARNGASTAISELRTYVEQLKDGSFIANANIVSKVDDAIAELYTSASSNYAKTYIFSTIDKNSQDIATIVSAATGDSVTVDIATRFATWKAGLATKSYVDGATAGLVAANDYNAAAIVAMINNAGSAVVIDADKIDFNASGNVNINAKKLYVTDYTSDSSPKKCYLGFDSTYGFDLQYGVGQTISHRFLIDPNGSISHMIDAKNIFSMGNTGQGYIGYSVNENYNHRPINWSNTSVELFDLFSVSKTSSNGGTIEIMGELYCDGEVNIGNTTYADDEIITQSAFTIGPATFNSSTLALSTNALTFGNFQIQNVTLGTTTYLCISPNSSVNKGLLISATGALGVNVNGVFKKGIDLSDTGYSTIQDFCNATGSSTSGYTIKNGLFVVA